MRPSVALLATRTAAMLVSPVRRLPPGLPVAAQLPSPPRGVGGGVVVGKDAAMRRAARCLAHAARKNRGQREPGTQQFRGERLELLPAERLIEQRPLGPFPARAAAIRPQQLGVDPL